MGTSSCCSSWTWEMLRGGQKTFRFLPQKNIILLVKNKLATFYNVPWSSLSGFRLMSFLQAKLNLSSGQAFWHPWMVCATFSEGFFTWSGHFPLRCKALYCYFQVITQGFKQNPRLGHPSQWPSCLWPATGRLFLAPSPILRGCEWPDFDFEKIIETLDYPMSLLWRLNDIMPRDKTESLW